MLEANYCCLNANVFARISNHAVASRRFEDCYDVIFVYPATSFTRSACLLTPVFS